MELKRKQSVFARLNNTGFNQARGGQVNKVCIYWAAGKCTRNPCKYLHTEVPHQQLTIRAQHVPYKRPMKAPHQQPTNLAQYVPYKQPNNWKRSPDTISSKNPEAKSGSVKEPSILPRKEAEDKSKTASATVKTKVCEKWLSGTCVDGEMCKYYHSWFCGNGFSLLAKLEGHSSSITGIALPSGSDKLYTAGSDKAIRVWDCNSGECKHVEFVSSEIGCLVSDGPRLYIGLENSVQICDLNTGKQLNLSVPVGQIYTLIAEEHMFYAGTQDGTIFGWKFSPDFSNIELVASLNGHTQSVTSLIIGCCNRLYSGSRDNTIRVWDLNSFRCIQTLEGHADAITSVLTWHQCLLSCSLDKTIKVWAESKSGEIELVHNYEQDHGFLALCGIFDAKSEPILLCSCDDNTVGLLDLPRLTERGRLFSKKVARAICKGPHGLFFTGNDTGEIKVWKLDGF